ncbi:MAG: response regulator transcription factor [Actinomycetota bacterium]
MRILLVEDDHRLASLIAERLVTEGYEAVPTFTGPEGLRQATSSPFDVVVLDVMLPELDGVTLVRTLRQHGIHVPVLMLTARDAVEHRVEGLRAGADDYLVKPFAFNELLARIEALTRRLGRDRGLRFGPLVLEPAARRVRVNGTPVELTAKEFDLLECLLRHRGRVLTRADLKEYVWDFSFDARTKVVDLYVHYLRRKLQEAGASDLIETVRGVGYAIGR